MKDNHMIKNCFQAFSDVTNCGSLPFLEFELCKDKMRHRKSKVIYQTIRNSDFNKDNNNDNDNSDNYDDDESMKSRGNSVKTAFDKRKRFRRGNFCCERQI